MNVSPARSISCLILFLLLKTFITAQNKDSVVSAYIDDLRNIWLSNSSQTFNQYLSSSSDEVSQIPAVFNFKDNAFDEQFKKKLQAREKVLRQEELLYRKDKGFNFIASYQYNIVPPIVDPDEAVVFRQRVQAGFEWDILRSGLFDNKQRAKQLKYKALAVSYERNNALGSLVLKNNYNMIIFLLNEEKISILLQRKQFLESFRDITKHLLSLNQITKENFLKVNQHLNDINYQINIYKRYNDSYSRFKGASPPKAPLPVFDIDYEKVSALIPSASGIDSADYYNMLAATDQNYFLRDITLKPNVKYNFYDVYNSFGGNRNFISAGVNLSVPLAMNHQLKKERDILNAELVALTKQNFGMDTQNVILNSLYEFSYKQKQYSNLLQKREMFEEFVRNEKVKQQFSNVEFNPLTANILLDDYWSTTIELLDLKQEMYRLLNDLKLNLPQTDLAQIIKPYVYDPVILNTASDPVNKNFKNVQAVYLWSDVFRNHRKEDIVNYCKLNNFNTLVVSGGENNIASLRELLNANLNVNFELMLSNNNLLKNGSLQADLDSISFKVPIGKLSAIHLDIEPHTLKDYKTNKDLYLQKYLQLIDEAFTFTSKNKLKLCVSIPVYYPDEVLKVLFSKCDHVYLMAYENIKQSFITEKIQEELKLGKEKVVLALRTNDFANKAQMDELFEKIGIKNTAYHDLDELIKMSRKNINKGEGK